MKETKKKIIKKKAKGKTNGKNKLVIDRSSGNVVRSTHDPVDLGHVQMHEVESVSDIIVTDASTFKAANELSECDRLEFDNGRLRSLLVVWHDFLQLDGKLYKLQVDPLARKIQVVDK